MRLGRLACAVALALHVAAASAAAQTFVFGAQGEPVQLDPAVITDGISSRITRQIYDGLVKYYPYSPTRAQELLKQAGLGSGLSTITWDDGRKEPLVFWYMSRSRPYFPNPKEIAEAMAVDLAKVGVKAQLQTAEWAVYLDKRKNGQMPLYMLGWTGDNGDPDNFLCYFFCAPGVSREGFYANQALTDVLLRAQKLTSQAERAKLYRQAEQMLHDDAGRLFIANNQPPMAFSRRVKGYTTHPTGSEYFNTVELQ